MNVSVLFAILAASALSLIPLSDLGTAPYAYGYIGGLYDDGTNVIPPDHLAAGLRQAALIQPRDAEGHPSAKGKIVFLTVGFGETARIHEAFVQMIRPGPSLVFINAAQEGLDKSMWMAPQSAGTFARIRNTLLEPAGLSEKQVQVAWVQLVSNQPTLALPPQSADAYFLKGAFAETLRELKSRYPNLQIAYLSSRVFGGYSTSSWNPEPFAYESALSVRWVILGQITLARTGFLWDTRIGPVSYERGEAPWVAWGPYFWANGTTARADGMTWQRDDFEAGGDHLSPAGARKGALMLLDFLLHEPTASGWFRADSLIASRRRSVRP